MSKRSKNSISIDWALIVVLVLSLCTSLYTLIRFRRFVRDVQSANEDLAKGFREDSSKQFKELQSIVNQFIGVRSSVSTNVVSSPIPIDQSSTNVSETVSKPSPLPSGFWVAQVAGDWILTDGQYSYSAGSLSPVGLILSTAQGVVVSETGVYYSTYVPVRSVKTPITFKGGSWNE